MKYKITIRPEAENDIEEAFAWYEDKRLGLGFDFLLQIDAGIRFIERDPNIYKSEYKGTKKHLLKRFPYKIIYMVKEREIIIIAAIHSKRSHAVIKRRFH